jgi:alkylated DNA repair dioxygenase AlkB
MTTATLFPAELPDGFAYRDDFISAAEEAALLRTIAHLTFRTFTMHGVAARRRVVFFGTSYEGDDALPLPPFLVPLRTAIAAWAEVPAERWSMALINEYPPGAPIGWHRDAPQYDLVAGVSLLTACPMRFRPYVPRTAAGQVGPPRRMTHEVRLEPRSAYLLRGAARSAFEHHIPPVTALRYSITFRTLRSARVAAESVGGEAGQLARPDSCRHV